ncbi:unnamed protein product [Soboliphyme baturini]|uniref:Endonuclease n=1 Tax=Soboliphyme baturini TaxID=241478 RepID=A0A183IG79_9BILA|nr:unnamed protein product [Soboliphyme baturini]
MAFGYPGFDNLRTFEDFVVSYDSRTRTAHWVMEHLTPDRMVYSKEVDRKQCVFSEDQSIHPFFRSTNDDYKNSGFDRGHLAPAGNHRTSQNAIRQTFLLSNMSPQVGKMFNRGKWNELEKYVRSLARRNRNVYICTGPLYLPRKEADNRMYVKYQVIGQNHVAVPTHFFKVILIQNMSGDWFLDSYVLPNERIDDRVDLKSFRVSLESIERAAGFLIFEKIRERNVKLIEPKIK